MDPSWHHHYPPPPPGGAPSHAAVCPVCAISHFPFCRAPYYPPHQYPLPATPLPHPTDQFCPRPSPPPPPQPFHQTIPPPPSGPAPYDPFIYNQSGPPINSHRPAGDPRSNISGFDRDPYGQGFSGFEYDNAGAKKMRFDDPGFSSVKPGPYKNESSHVFFDDARRLKLIREHGGSMNSESNINFGEQRQVFDSLPEPGFKQAENFERKTLDSSYSCIPQYSNPYSDFIRESSFNVQDLGVETNGQQHRKRHLEQKQIGHAQADGSLNPKNSYGTSLPVVRQNQHFIGKHEFHEKNEVQRHLGSMHNHYDMCSNRHGGSYQVYNDQAPLPQTPRPRLSEAVVSPSPSRSSVSSIPAPMSSSAVGTSMYLSPPETRSTFHPRKEHMHGSPGYGSEAFQETRQVPTSAFVARSEVVPSLSQSPEKHRVFDASDIIKPPHRATRPDHIVIILRGLPGSGKSYLAKILRDLEVEHGGSAPRIHSMDDYFMTEVEREEAGDISKSSGSVRGKRQLTKTVMEYCFEAEMEEAYRSSMLKAFKKTLDEGDFSFVIVDDRNLRVADFAQFWATAKRSGYEVYLLEAPYKDPLGCAARNVHGFTQEEVQKMAKLWEEAPPMYLKLDIKSLLHGDASVESGIQEVDMDMEDEDPGRSSPGSEDRDDEKVAVPNEGDLAFDGPEYDQRSDGEADRPVEKVKELGKSKWSNDSEEDNIRKTEAFKSKSDALSGLKKSYLKEGKSVRWGDEVGNSGFSIAAARTANSFSLVIGPGSGYNSKSNPLPEEDRTSASRYNGNSKNQNIFQERLRAEQESFKAVFDKRRERVGGFKGTDD